jgi:hypothetical protein
MGIPAAYPWRLGEDPLGVAPVENALRGPTFLRDQLCAKKACFLTLLSTHIEA